jgi:hypothetical protein
VGELRGSVYENLKYAENCFDLPADDIAEFFPDVTLRSIYPSF